MAEISLLLEGHPAVTRKGSKTNAWRTQRVAYRVEPRELSEAANGLPRGCAVIILGAVLITQMERHGSAGAGPADCRAAGLGWLHRAAGAHRATRTSAFQ